MTTHNHGGRPPKSPAKRTARKTVTLRQEQIGAVQLLQDGEEEFSTTLQRLLDTHPDVIAMLELRDGDPIMAARRVLDLPDVFAA